MKCRVMRRNCPNISVIIPALDEELHIEKAIHSVAGADEVLVVDGGSHDATCEIVGNLPCELIHAPSGRGQQLRIGAGRAAGDVLFFLHADCWLAQGALEQLRDLAKGHQNKPLFGAFRQRIDGPQMRYRWLERGNAARVNWCRLPYGDQGMFIDRESYRASGEMAAVPLMEDVMLSRAAAKICSPVLLPGPIHLSPRRWQKHGVVSRTLQNWFILSAFYCGVPPERLAKWYT